MPESDPEKPSVSSAYREGFKLCFSHLWLWLVPLVIYLLGYVAVLTSLFSATMYRVAQPDLLNLSNKMALDGLPFNSRLVSAWQAVNSWAVIAQSIRTLFTADLVALGGFLALAILALIFYHGLETLFRTHDQLRTYYKYVVGILALCLVVLTFSFFAGLPNLFRIVLALGLLAWSFLLAAFFSVALLVYLGYLRDKVRQEPSEVSTLFLRSGMSLAPIFALIVLMGVASGAAARLITNANSVTALIFGRTAAAGALFAAQAPWQVLAISSAVLAALCLFAAILLALHPTNHISLAFQKTIATTLLRVGGWLVFLLTGTLAEALLLFLRQLCLALPVYWLWYDTLIQMFFGGLQILFLAGFTAALMVWLDEARSPLPKRIVVRLTSSDSYDPDAVDMLNPVELTEEIQADTEHFEHLENELNQVQDYPYPPQNISAIPWLDSDSQPFEFSPAKNVPAYSSEIKSPEPSGKIEHEVPIFNKLPEAKTNPPSFTREENKSATGERPMEIISQVVAKPQIEAQTVPIKNNPSSMSVVKEPEPIKEFKPSAVIPSEVLKTETDFSHLPKVQNEKVAVENRPAEIVSKIVEPIAPVVPSIVKQPTPEIISEVPVTPAPPTQVPEAIIHNVDDSVPGGLHAERRRGMDDAVQAIWDRNARVELDKAWETSWTRRIFIAIVTYVVALAWLLLIHEPLAPLKAVVPVAGYILSTLSLPPLKYLWIKWYAARPHPAHSNQTADPSSPLS